MSLKTSPNNLRKLAFVLEKCDLNDAVYALHRAADDIDTLKNCVNFFASVIKSGESWTPTCEEMFGKTKYD